MNREITDHDLGAVLQVLEVLKDEKRIIPMEVHEVKQNENGTEFTLKIQALTRSGGLDGSLQKESPLLSMTEAGERSGVNLGGEDHE